jgi:8-oxo-dGTP pyrophosphatase MutT (NUDIX family)
MRAPNRVVSVIYRDGRILLVHRFRAGTEFWVFPCAMVELGEDPFAAMKRRIQEVTGLGVLSNQQLFEEQDEHAFTWFYYICELGPGEPVFGGPELEEQSPTNQYRLDWVEPGQLNILKPYPLPDRLVAALKATTLPTHPFGQL